MKAARVGHLCTVQYLISQGNVTLRLHLVTSTYCIFPVNCMCGVLVNCNSALICVYSILLLSTYYISLLGVTYCIVCGWSL